MGQVSGTTDFQDVYIQESPDRPGRQKSIPSNETPERRWEVRSLHSVRSNTMPTPPRELPSNITPLAKLRSQPEAAGLLKVPTNSPYASRSPTMGSRRGSPLKFCTIGGCLKPSCLGSPPEESGLATRIKTESTAVTVFSSMEAAMKHPTCPIRQPNEVHIADHGPMNGSTQIPDHESSDGSIQITDPEYEKSMTSLSHSLRPPSETHIPDIESQVGSIQITDPEYEKSEVGTTGN